MPVDIPKFFRSVRFALKGLRVMIFSENNARIHLIATGMVVVLALFLNVSKRDWVSLLIAIVLVWVTELINTAIEKTVDMVSPEYRKIAGDIKDLAAGAVLVAALFAVVIGVLTFKDYVPWEDWAYQLHLLKPEVEPEF
ncbi:MAG: diacylglycerol kinase family protein [Siphonobacter sp.]